MAAEWKAAPGSSSPAWDVKGKQQSQHHRHHKSAAAASYSSSWVRKPPLPPDHYSVPLWEKKFVKEVGNKSWKKLLDDQNSMKYIGSSTDLVLKWDDSGALEAFQNAKARFRAKYFGYNSNILLPDPDMFIDEVDFYASINPELVDDLEKISLCPVLVDDPPDGGFVDCTDLPIIPTGWDSSDDLIPNNNITHHSVNCDHPIGEPINYHVAARLGNQAGFFSTDVNQDFCYACNDGFAPSYPDVVPTGWDDAEVPAKNCDGDWDHQTPLVDATGWGYADQTVKGNITDWDNLVDCRTQVQDITRCPAALGTNSPGCNVEDGNSYASNAGGADKSWSSRRQNNWNSGMNNTRNWEPQRRNGRKRDGANWNGSIYSKYQDCDNGGKSRRRYCWAKKNTDHHYVKT